VWNGSNNNINARQQQREHGSNNKTSDSCTPTARADREGRSVDGFVSRAFPHLYWTTILSVDRPLSSIWNHSSKREAPPCR
ncbi:unnamed protein product, partial [Ectocarpus sp. 8 AP-2014]